MKNNREYIKWGITGFLVILCSIISYYVIFHFSELSSRVNNLIGVLMPVIDGLILGYLMTPIVNSIENHWVKPLFKKLHVNCKKPRIRLVSILITVVIVCAVFVGFLSIVIPQIGNSINTILAQFPSYINSVSTGLTNLIENNDSFNSWMAEVFGGNSENFEQSLIDIINEYSTDFQTFLSSELMPQMNSLLNTLVNISTGVYSVFKQLWNIVIGFIISIYLLASKELFAAQAKKIAYAFLPTGTANRLINNVRFANQTFGGFFVGKILDSIIMGLLCFIGTTLIGTPFAVLVSVIIGVTNVIPFFGPFLGAIPSFLLILLVNPMQAIYFVIFVFLLQQLDGNIIGPKILGSSTGLSSFWVIFAITLFGGIWGVFGMIVGTPIFAVIFALVKSVVELRLANKELPPETAKYLRLLYIDTEESNKFVEFTDDDKKASNKKKVKRIVIKNNYRMENNKNTATPQNDDTQESNENKNDNADENNK